MEDDNESESSYIKLISAEGSEIFLARRVALQVETLRAMLEGGFRESEEGVIRFPDMSGSALEKVVKYLYYKDRYANSSARIPEFAIEPEEVCWVHIVIFIIHNSYLFCSFGLHWHNLLWCVAKYFELLLSLQTTGLRAIGCSELSQLLAFILGQYINAIGEWIVDENMMKLRNGITI